MAGRKLTTRQAGRIAGVHTSTIRRWIVSPEKDQRGKGMLPATRTLGGQYRIDEEVLTDLIKNR